MILPYVYRLIHKETGRYYFGYRSRNVILNLKSDNDLGIKYFTSSRVIKPAFFEYNFEILAEFYTKEDAYDFEQSLIREHWGDVLLLNKHYHGEDKGQWKNTGHSKESREKMSGLKRSPEFSEYRCLVMTGNIPWNKGLTKETDARVAAYAAHRASMGNEKLKGITRPSEVCTKISDTLTGYVHTDETRNNMSKSAKIRAARLVECKCGKLVTALNLARWHKGCV